ncbi:uncharacterized protein EDB91DRAFT_1242870 [Suillus paluster]|uniref:uncharacterized protein n=1 Tax=Suillus paluster TaxID=48578 RepID=UPI001B85FD56|nr:uncharacterized protein EDB91DRAFT_1242870 [Suillus paluster]KAG1753907.1 hypothetical protein EDB91DRAFT_1242870 [Suillus paluster]
MTGVLTHCSTVYPEVQCQEANDVTLQPLLLRIGFSGRLPRHLIEQNIPIEITVSIAEEYGSFAMPVVRTMSLNLWRSNSGSLSYADDAFKPSEPSDEFIPPADVPIPFLPLPLGFDYTKRSDWATLSKQIEGWLAELDTELPQWMWGRDTFWLTFVAAFPSFPRGTWPKWDSRIPLEGAFIEQWLEASSSSARFDEEIFEIVGDAQEDVQDLCEIWGAFCRDVALFFPYPLIATTD